MITVVIATRNDEERLAHALAALAPAAMDGIVRDAIVVDGGSRDGTLAVADAAGCVVLHGSGREGLLRAAEIARGDWLLLVAPGTLLAAGWSREALEFMDRAVLAGEGRTRAATFRLRRPEGGVRARLAEAAAGLRTRLFAAPYAEQGLLISRAFYTALDGHRDLPAMADVDLARRIGRRRLSLLRTPATVSRAAEGGAGVGRGLRNAACLGLFVLRLPPRLIGRLAR